MSWKVVVVYENTDGRELAISFCDRMVERFWRVCDFDVSWWSFDELKKSDCALQAREKACAAQALVLAALPDGQLPEHIQSWIEGWLYQRGDREGSLVGLLQRLGVAAGCGSEKHLYLRHVAHRGGMDYLTEVPQSITYKAADSPESYTHRALQVTGTLDEILHTQDTSPLMPP